MEMSNQKHQTSLLSIGLLLAFCQSLLADVFIVTREDDPIPDGCLSNDCSLREAVMAANNNPGNDDIFLLAGRYDIQILSDQNMESETGDLDVTSDELTIMGMGHWLTRIDGDYLDRIFDVVDASLVLKGLNLQRGGTFNEDGGGIRVIDGHLTVDNVVIERMSADRGAGISFDITNPNNIGELNIFNSVIKRNFSRNHGSALYCAQCDIEVVNSEFAENDSSGSAIALLSSIGSIKKSTIRDNVGNYTTFRMDASGSFELHYNTISGNTTKSGATTVTEFNHVGPISLVGNTIINNTGSGVFDVFFFNATVLSFDHNIINQSCTGTGPGNFNIINENCGFFPNATDLVVTDSVDLGLSPLANNGGVGLTHEIEEGSLVKNFQTTGCTGKDQRSISRVGATCDAGAFQSGFCADSGGDIPNGDPTGVTSVLMINGSADILNLDLFVDIEHTGVGDLELILKHQSSGTVIPLVDQPDSGTCIGHDMKLLISEDDVNAPLLASACESVAGFTGFQAYRQLVNKYLPTPGSLAQFTGMNIGGQWTLQVIDHNDNNRIGQLKKWCLYPELGSELDMDIIFKSDFE